MSRAAIVLLVLVALVLGPSACRRQSPPPPSAAAPATPWNTPDFWPPEIPVRPCKTRPRLV